MRYSNRHNGFTLLEVLLATLIGAFVLVVALVSFRTVAASRTELETYCDLMAQCDFVYQQMRSDLANIYRQAQPNQMKLACIPEQYYDHKAGRLLFYRVSSPQSNTNHQASGDLFEIEYGLIIDPDQHSALARREAPVLQAETGNPQGILTRLAENVTDLSFDFYDGRSWQSDWNNPSDLPSMVRLNMVLTDSEGLQHISFSQEFSLEPIPEIQTPEPADNAPSL